MRMLIEDNTRARARMLTGTALALSAAIVLVAYFGMDDGGWQLLIPVLASAAATIWPNRIVVAIAMILTAAIVVLGVDGSGVLFGASSVALMLALNSLQLNATRIRRRARVKISPE